MFARFFRPPDGEHYFSELSVLNTDEVLNYTYTSHLRKVGEFTMVLSFREEYLSKIRLNDLFRFDGDWLIVKGIAYSEKSGITLTGTDLKGILSQRITVTAGTEPDAVKGTTASCIKHFLDKNIISPEDSERAVPMVFNANGITGLESDGYRCSLEDLSEVISTLCEGAGIGYTVQAATVSKKLEIRLIKGVDRSIEQSERPRVIFCRGWGNVREQSFEHDIGNYYNTVYAVDSQSEVIKCVYREDTIPRGIERQETTVDVSAPEISEIEKYALAQVQDNEEVIGYEVIPTANGYGTDYTIGDTVTVRDPYIGNSFSAVIEEAEKEYSNGKMDIKVSPGTHKQKLLNRIINNMRNGTQKRR